MSQSVSTEDPGSRVEPPAANPEVERIARANGWRPRSEWSGNPDDWKPADLFVAYGLDNPGVLAHRNRILADRLEKQLDKTSALERKVDETINVVNTLTTMN